MDIGSDTGTGVNDADYGCHCLHGKINKISLDIDRRSCRPKTSPKLESGRRKKKADD